MSQPEDTFEALLPPEMVEKAEQVGVRKITMDRTRMVVLSLLAGAFIGLGGFFSTTVLAGASTGLPYGVGRLLAGLVFSLGLILVLVGGAELFTGNTLGVMAWTHRKVSTRLLLESWSIVYVGNFIGSLALALLVFVSGQYAFGDGAVGQVALNTANSKVSRGFVQVIALGIIANLLVCLGVWLTYSARTTTDRILAIILPVAAFVATETEHCVANMYLIPMGLLIKAWAAEPFWAGIGSSAAAYPRLTWDAFLLNNLLPSSIGNIIGGGLLVGVVYWFAYCVAGAERPQS